VAEGGGGAVRLPAGQKIVSFFKVPSRALWSTNPPIHLGSNVTLSCGDEQSELEFLHIPSSAKFVNAWGYLHATVRRGQRPFSMAFTWRIKEESRNGSGVAQRVPEGLGSRIFVTFGT
jgi:hypothetical protein